MANSRASCLHFAHSHLLPNMPTNFLHALAVFFAVIPGSRHVDEDDIVGKSPRWIFPVLPIPHRRIICDFIPLQFPSHDRVGKKIDDIASLPPCFHYCRVHLFVPDEGYHAVDTIGGVVFWRDDISRSGGFFSRVSTGDRYTSSLRRIVHRQVRRVGMTGRRLLHNLS